MIGHLVAHRGGHELHAAFAEKFLQETDAWQMVESPSVVDSDPVGAAVAVTAATPEQLIQIDNLRHYMQGLNRGLGMGATLKRKKITYTFASVHHPFGILRLLFDLVLQPKGCF